MFDLLDLRISADLVSLEDLQLFKSETALIQKINKHGEILWESPCSEQLRSDQNYIQIQLGSHDLKIRGCPARTYAENNVFGSSDILYCFRAMINFVNRVIGSNLTLDFTQYRVKQVDVTHNYDMGSGSQVLQAIKHLRHAESFRRKPQYKGFGVYWVTQIMTLKAYPKGQDLKRLCRSGKATATEEELELALRLLRLEIALKTKWFNRLEKNTGKKWYQLTTEDYDREFEKHFDELIGQEFNGVFEIAEVETMLQDKLKEVAPTEGQAKAAYMMWLFMKSNGYEITKDSMPKSTFARHKKFLRLAGVSLADMSAGNIVPIRRKRLIIAEPVRSWAELRARAA